MAPRRRRTPAKAEDEILFLVDHTCCVCHVRGKDVQIHHVDGDPRNYDPENLAVVCLDCHSRITGTRGLGKAYTPGEIRKYKRSWEHQVLSSRRIHRPVLRYRKELISQIDLTVCEILACKKDYARVGALLDLLYELHLWRGNHEIDKKIIEGLHHLALMSGLGSPRLAEMVAEKLWEMCWQFAGPKDVPMSGQDLATVLTCVDALDTLATFNCEFGHGRKAVGVIARQMEHFFEIGMWYSKTRIADAVIRAYERALKGCYLVERQTGRERKRGVVKKELQFGYGRAKLRQSIRRIGHIIREQKPAWKYQRHQLNQLLTI